MYFCFVYCFYLFIVLLLHCCFPRFNFISYYYILFYCLYLLFFLSFIFLTEFLFPRILTHHLFFTGKELPGAYGYKYYGAAKDLPGVRELFQEKDDEAEMKRRKRLDSVQIEICNMLIKFHLFSIFFISF